MEKYYRHLDISEKNKNIEIFEEIWNEINNKIFLLCDIPFEFSSGEKEHREKVEGQTGDYVFEEGEPEELKALEEKK